jgi:hypothetical protein
MLRTALKLDAVVTGANGAAYLLLAGPLGELLGLAPGLLRGVGAFLLAFAALVWMAGEPREPDRVAVSAIVAANALWVLASLGVALTGGGSPTTAGTLWIACRRS